MEAGADSELRTKEHAAADKSPESGVKGFSLPNFWPPRPAPEPAKWENGEGRSINPWSDDRSPTEWKSVCRLLIARRRADRGCAVSTSCPPVLLGPHRNHFSRPSNRFRLHVSDSVLDLEPGAYTLRNNELADGICPPERLRFRAMERPRS